MAVSHTVMIWRGDSHQAREDRRERLSADPAWLAFIPKTRGCIAST